MADTDTTSEPNAEFTLTRTIDAPQAVVWQLWTDPDELARWFHPKEMTTPRDSVEVDLREGGGYAYTMVDDRSGERFPTGGSYLEVSEPDRLVFTWAEPGAPVEEAPVVTVTLADRGGRTEVTLHVRGVPGRPGDDDVYDGWAQALDHLAAYAASGDRR